MPHHGQEIPEEYKSGLIENESTQRMRASLDEMQSKLGATNRFPQGKLNAEDQGELQLAVAVDKEKKKIIVAFGKEISWVGFDKQSALYFANTIISRANEI